MVELVDRIATSTGLDRTVAEKAIGIVLDFLSTEGPADKVMGVGTRLMGLGLDMGQIQVLTRELMAVSQEHGAGPLLGEIAAAIPGLSQFI